MPASKGKNLLYRLALPVLSPVAASDPVAGIKGAPVACRKNLLTIIRRNHVTGGAILLSCEDRDSFICTRAFHTDQIPDENTYFRVAERNPIPSSPFTHIGDGGSAGSCPDADAKKNCF